MFTIGSAILVCAIVGIILGNVIFEIQDRRGKYKDED